MTRPKTRTATLDAATTKAIKTHFGTLKNAFATLNKAGLLNGMMQDTFTRVAAGRPSLPADVKGVSAALEAWKKANLK